MGQTSGYIPGPFQGVSQAPPQVRIQGTCEEMTNCLPALPFGVSVRPPLKYAHSLLAADAEAHALLAHIVTAQGEMELLINREGGSNIPRLKSVVDGSAIALTVTPAAQTYLDTLATQPNRDFQVLTIEDTVFVTNRRVTVGLLGTTAPARPFEALIWVKQGNYAQRYSVTVDPLGASPTVTAGYNTASGASANDNYSIPTDAIAEGLYNATIRALSSAVVSGAPLNTLALDTETLRGSLIYLADADEDFTITVKDDNAGTGIKAFKDSVQRFSDLPSIAEDGIVFRIAAEAVGGDSDYWIAFEATSSDNQGIWREVRAPGSADGLDPTTMPVTLTYSGGWTLDTGAWTGRTVGDAAHSPDPPFVGNTIKALSWFKGRLKVLWEGGTVLSSSSSPYQFYTTTLATALDSDPIGLLNPSPVRSSFSQVVAFDEGRLLILGDNVQALLAADRDVAAGKVGLDTLSSTTVFSDQVPAMTIGRRVYFGAIASEGLEVYEYAVDRLSGGDVDEPMTAGCPTYIPTTIDRTASSKQAFLALFGTSGDSTVYVMNARYSEQQRVQNAFHRWELPEDLGLAGWYFSGYTLHLAMVQGARMLKFTMDLSPMGQDDVTPNGLIHLDYRIPGTLAGLAAVYDSGADTTTISGFPTASAPEAAGVKVPLADYPFGFAPEVVSSGSTSIVLRGDWTASLTSFVFGRFYDATLEPTTIFPLGQDQKPMWQGTLRLDALLVDCLKTSAIRVTAATSTRTNVAEYAGPDSTVGLGVPLSRKHANFRAPVNDNSVVTTITFSNVGFLGFTLVGFEWTGDWTPRSRRVT